MAAITPRKNKSGEIISYTIRVYRGYDSTGNRLKPYTMTYKPEPGMTAKQVEKELNRQAVQFEEKCMRGGVADPTIRLCDFCEKYIEIAKGTLSPTTYAFYQEQIRSLIVPALGHFKLKISQPLTFSSIYNSFQICRYQHALVSAPRAALDFPPRQSAAGLLSCKRY